MIQDGCPINGDTSLNIQSNGNSLQGRFDIKMFKFIGEDLNDVWLHCTGRYFILGTRNFFFEKTRIFVKKRVTKMKPQKVRACNATETNACVPDCTDNNRKRRSESSDMPGQQKKKLNYLSLDYMLEADFPIQRKRDLTVEMEIEERIIITQGTVTILQREYLY